MLRFLFWTVVFSIGSIYLANHILEHFKTKYASKQTKNLVEIQTHKYKQMVEELTKKVNHSYRNNPLDSGFDSDSSLASCHDYLSPDEKLWMVEQLQDFVKNKN